MPDPLKAKYKEAFEVDPEFMIKMAAERGKWIDQSQSLNVFLKGTSGKQLSDVYLAAWRMGLKTTYYLRTLAASQIEKSTLDASKFGFTQKREYAEVPEQPDAKAFTVQAGPEADRAVVHAVTPPLKSLMPASDAAPKTCSILDPDCEACQ